MRHVHRHILVAVLFTVLAASGLAFWGVGRPAVPIADPQAAAQAAAPLAPADKAGKVQVPDPAFVQGERSDARRTTSRGAGRPPFGSLGDDRASALAKQNGQIDKSNQAEKIARQRAGQQRAKQLEAKLGYDPTLTDPHQIAQQIAANLFGWTGAEYACFDHIITVESNWSVTATNPSSGAYGLPQSLPASKMASEGSDWRTNPGTQLRWGLRYIQQTYGTPCNAWSFHLAHNAY